MTPTAVDVVRYLGQGDEPSIVALAGEHLKVITAWVKSYTRGIGFDEQDEPEDPIAAVIIAATARLTNNPNGMISVSIDDYTARTVVFEGFNLVERSILDGYRRKAA